MITKPNMLDPARIPVIVGAGQIAGALLARSGVLFIANTPPDARTFDILEKRDAPGRPGTNGRNIFVLEE